MARQVYRRPSVWRLVAMVVVATSVLMLMFALMVVLIGIVAVAALWQLVLPQPKVTVLRSTNSWAQTVVTQMLATLPYRGRRR